MSEEKITDLLEQSEHISRTTLAEKARKDLFFLDKYVLNYDLMTKKAHEGLCLIVESLMNYSDKILKRINAAEKPYSLFYTKKEDWFFRNQYEPKDLKKKSRLILMPRGSFKSTCVTIGYVLQLLLIDSNLRILVDSETFDKSRAFIAEIIGHLENNEKYRELYKALYGIFPDHNKSRDKWTNSELNVGGRTKKSKEPTVSAAGIGVTKVGMHYDVIIGDDWQSEKNITTKEQIDTVVDHYKLSLSLLEPNGIFVVIGTRWDYKDIYQYILDNEKHRFVVYAKQAIFPDGKLFFPERLTENFLESQKISQGSYFFSNQYLNLPIDDETATFKASQMQRIDPDDVKNKPINWFMMIDPAISQEKTADFTAFVIAGLDTERNIYVKYILKGKFLPSEIVNHTFNLYEEFQPKKVGLETVAFQQTLKYALNDKMKERGWWIPLVEVKRKTTQSKEQRIKGLQPYYEFGHIYHFKGCPFIEDLEYELIHFPKGQNDDIIDALADILEIGFPPSKSRLDRVQKVANRLAIKKMWKPRSKITGY